MDTPRRLPAWTRLLHPPAKPYALPGYSLLGAGMNATVVQILCPSCDIQGTVVVGTHDSQGISLDQTIANLTITGNQNPPLFGYINDTLTLDHVYLSSGFDNGRPLYCFDRPQARTRQWTRVC